MSCRAATLFVIWIVWGLGLLMAAAVSWLRSEQVQGWIWSLQLAYGAGEDPPWLLRADAHVHITVACLASLWFGLGCRLFAPRAIPWLPLALTVLVALSDELAQLGSLQRHFEWSDQLADAVGLGLSVPLLLWLRRLPVVAPPTRP